MASMTSEDARKWMELAVSEARRCQGEAGRISPRVGAVAVSSDGQFLGSSYRGADDDRKEHAEFHLLERTLKHQDLANATIFTTLEPCRKRSPNKTPCSERLVMRQVSRVYIGMLDPDPTVHGKGQIEPLNRNIQVATFEPDLTKQIYDLNRHFIDDRTKPMLTIDASIDGRKVQKGKVEISGKIRRRPDDGEHFAVLTQRGNRYWPQRSFAINLDDTWRCTLHEEQPGRTTILVIQADPGTYLWIKYYDVVGSRKGVHEALELTSLPESVRLLDQATIDVVA